MTVVAVPQHIFRDPAAAAAASSWLSSLASPQERALLASFFGLFSGPSSTRKALAAQCSPALQTGAAALRPGSAGRHSAQGAPVRQRPSTAGAARTGARQCPRSPAVESARPGSAAAPRMSSTLAASAAERCRPSTAGCTRAADWLTTNEQFYGLRDAYPDLYAAALRATQALPVDAGTFRSEYAESLKNGARDFWKRYLCTTYESANQQLHGLEPCNDASKQAGLARWVQRQRLHYGVCLTDAAANTVDDALVNGAGPQQQASVLAAVRLLYAVVQPDKCASSHHLPRTFLLTPPIL